MNPCTVSWYVPILKGMDCGGEWESQEMDAKFRRGLPDGEYVGRLVYRGLVMSGCPRVVELDGIRISDGERSKVGELLRKLEKSA